MRTVARIVVGVLVALNLVVLPASPALACNDVAPYCDSVDGTIHDGTGIGTLPQVPGDPSPTASGIWLGHTVSAGFCYADHNRFAVDGDHDWLDDECELQLARAFAPVLRMHPQDGCPGGEPYWAAKYFRDAPTDFVRIAYMPAYYRDCGQGVYGFGGGHDGDSEYIMIGVEYNLSTRHWQVREAWLSAHSGTITDSSDYIADPGLLEYPTRPLAYPQIWIVRAKHANYRSKGECGDGAWGFDDCHGNVAVGRVRIYRNRNVGSRFLDRFPNGVMADNPTFHDIWRTEYFYAPHRFRGWQPNFPDGVTPYADFLTGVQFDCYKPPLVAMTSCNWGPGPNPPTSYELSADIDGPQQVTWHQPYTWTTFVTGGQLPYQGTWSRKYASEATPVPLGGTTGGTFSAGSMTFTADRCESFTLTMTVTSPNGQVFTGTHPVTVTCPPPPPPPLGVYVTGPGLISTKGTYAYTAVTSSAAGPTFAWSERFCDDQAGSVCTDWVNTSGLGNTYNRTLTPDCSGTGEKTFWVHVLVTDSSGQTAEAEQPSSLCASAPL